MTRLASLKNAYRWLRRGSDLPSAADHAAVGQIRARAAKYLHVNAAALRQEVDTLRQQVRQGSNLLSPEILHPASALVLDALRRVIKISLFDVQLLAGLALSRGQIVEMQTGEGKTFAAALPAFLHGLTGRGVHVLTVNSYLAERDFRMLSPAFELLGLSVGLVLPQATQEQKRAAYASDVTYGPGYEFGFDYLRDQIALRTRQQTGLGDLYRRTMRGEVTQPSATVQRGFEFAVIDEADSVLIDEASCPLVLSGAVPAPAANAEAFLLARDVAKELQLGCDYNVNEAAGAVSLTRQGEEKIFPSSHRAGQYGLDRPWRRYVEQALRAQHLLKRDVHYIMGHDQVMLVDHHTGRVFADRTWSNGLHQAVQAKEGCTILAENLPMVRMSRQRFFRLYEGISGLTGTACSSRKEFHDVYRLPVVTIPVRRPCQRQQLPTRYFADQNSKYSAIAKEIELVHASGRPILVGTPTIEVSQVLAERMDALHLSYFLLNGKLDADEAAIVSGAGEVGAITIATNMAGRGTDIKLGPGAAEFGGLHVIGCERHESSRVDRQLAGRAARQGDPGSCRFFVSADDPLLLQHGVALSRHIKQAACPGGEALDDYSSEIDQAQRRAEQLRRLQRKQLFVSDDWLEEVLSKLLSPG